MNKLKNKAVKMGSKTEEILSSIIGDENKRYLLYQFISSPDAYACNAFAFECLRNPEVVQKVNSNDPSTTIARTTLKDNDIVIDFGAGKGRFLEKYKMQKELIPNIDYYAYDKYGYEVDGKTDTESSSICKEVLGKFGINADTHYYGSEQEFDKFAYTVAADKVLLINVFHEIALNEWLNTFQKVYQLLKDGGILVIVEREELTIGEKPFDSDFFVMQKESMEILLQCKQDEFVFKRHPESDKVMAFLIPKELLCIAKEESVTAEITNLEAVALKKIREIKGENNSHKHGSYDR